MPGEPFGGVGVAALGTGAVIAGVISEVNVAALFAGKGTPAQCRGAATGDGTDGAVLCRRKSRSSLEQFRDKAAQRLQHCGGSAHDGMASFGLLARQSAGQSIDQAQGILAGLMGQVQIHHGGGDLFMPEKLLDGVQVRAGFQHVRGE